MQGKEPTSSLVHTFCNEVCRVGTAVIDLVFVFERVMPLCVRHRTTVEPNIDQIAFSPHRFSGGTSQHHRIHNVAVQVNLVVVLTAHIASHETFQRIVVHVACCNGFFNLLLQLLYTTDTDVFIAFFGAPNRQWDAPESGAA